MPTTPDLPLVRAVSIGDGVTTQFTIPFPFLERDYVYVTVDGIPTDFEWVVDELIVIEPAPPMGSEVVRYRQTYSLHAKHIFEGGVPFRPRYIDENNTQLFNVMQEAVGWASRAIDIALLAWDMSKEALDTSNEALGKADLAIQIAMEARDIAQAALEAALGYTQVVTITEDTTLDINYGGMWVRAVVPTGNVLTVTVPVHSVAGAFTPAEMVVQVSGGGYVQFQAGNGSSIEHMQGTAPLIKGDGTPAALKQVAAGEWVLYGALEDL